MTRKQRRLTMIASAGVVLAVAAALVLVALRDQIVFFYSPTELAEKALAPGTRVRLGGLVEEGSVVRERRRQRQLRRHRHGEDDRRSTYRGILPDLFREGQGIVAEGVLAGDGGVTADTVLAKHDENYMPKEVVDALKAQGVWKEGEGATQ